MEVSDFQYFENPEDPPQAPLKSSKQLHRQKTSTHEELSQMDIAGGTKELTMKLGRHRIFTWVHTETGEENVPLDDSDVANRHGVPRQVLIKTIRNAIKHEAAFLTLPWAILLVITFIVCFIGHDRTNEIRNIEDAVNVDLHENAVFAYSTPFTMAHKDVNDVHNIADVFSWLRIGLVPLLFRSQKTWSELFPGSSPWIDTPLTVAEGNSYLQYNRLVGGIRLSQSRGEPNSCANEKLAGAYDMSCSPSDSVTSLDLTIQPEYLDIISENAEFDKHFTQWFLLNEGKGDVENRLRQMEVSNWIDNSTVHVAVHFLSYNAHLNCLTLSGIHFFFARSGRLWKKIVHSAAFLDPYAESHLLGFDIVFMVLVLRLVIVELIEIYAFYKHRLPNSGFDWLMEYLNWWNLVDWISIALTSTLIIMWLGVLREVYKLEEDVSYLSTREAALRTQGFSESLTFADHLDELVLHFKRVYDFNHSFRKVASVFPVCLMLRLFKAFSAQPRLALVTQTLHAAMVDVGHFMVVFFAIFATFVLMAVALFGREMPEFSTFTRAWNSCFVVLMGDFDYEAMFAEARVLGSIWFWLFQSVLALVMLNMLLAIIMDTYTEVKSQSMEMETLFEQLAVLIRRWRWISRGEGLPLWTIDLKLAESFGTFRSSELKKYTIETKWHRNDIMTIKGFADLIDGLEEPQAARLVTLAVRNWRLEHLEPLSLTEAMNVVGLIHRQVTDQSKTIAQNHHQLVTYIEGDRSTHPRSSNGNERSHAPDQSEPLSPQSEGHGLNRIENREGIERVAYLELALQSTNEKLDTVTAKLDAMTAKFDHCHYGQFYGPPDRESRLATMEGKLQTMEASLQRVEELLLHAVGNRDNKKPRSYGFCGGGQSTRDQLSVSQKFNL